LSSVALAALAEEGVEERAVGGGNGRGKGEAGSLIFGIFELISENLEKEYNRIYSYQKLDGKIAEEIK